MKYTTLLEKTSDAAVEYFRGKDLEEAYTDIDELRKMLIWKNEACGNVRAEFNNRGISFQLKDMGCIEKILGQLSKIQMRLTQLRNYYDDEIEFEKLQSEDWRVSMSSKFFHGGATIVDLKYPEWRF